jgi:hypothetical protein
MSTWRNLVLAVTTAMLTLHCGASAKPQHAAAVEPTPAGTSVTVAGEAAAQSKYLERIATSGDLYARRDGKIVDAPAADIAVLRGYPAWSAKGPLQPDGQRLTILTAKTEYSVGEEIRIVHVHEATRAGVELFIMGPKAIHGEYVDDVLVGQAGEPATSYDGAVLASPGADHNYEVSVHRLPAGRHTLQWNFVTLSGPSRLRSNVLTVVVR